MKLITKLTLTAMLIAVACFTFGKPSAAITANLNETVDRHLSGFTAINVAGPFDVYITQGSSESVNVEAPADVMDKILTEVNGGVLKIYKKDQHWKWNDGWGHKKVAVHVSVKSIEAISLTGSGDAFFKDGIKAATLKLKISGSGDMTGKLIATTLDCAISGSGDMRLSGSAGTSTISVVGSGDYSAPGLITSSTTISITGSGDADINVNKKLKATVHGSGDIHYHGGPDEVSKVTTGSGDIIGS